MRYDEIAIFVAVSEAGSFVGAARRLGVPTSTVSARVAALEKRLGLTLIQRTTRKLRLTEAGQSYFEECRSALRQIEAAEDKLTSHAGSGDGLLRVTAPVDISQSLLPPVIAGFRNEFPGVHVDLIVTDRIADLVAEGIDIAVRVGPLRDSSLITRTFVSGPSGLFASADYLDRRGAPQTLDDLIGHDLIGFGKLRGQALRMINGNETADVRLAGALTCDDFLTTRSFVALGLGIGFLPAFLATEITPPLVRVLPQYAHQLTGLYFAYPAQRFVPLRVKHFIAYAAKAASSVPTGRER